MVMLINYLMLSSSNVRTSSTAIGDHFVAVGTVPDWWECRMIRWSGPQALRELQAKL